MARYVLETMYFQGSHTTNNLAAMTACTGEVVAKFGLSSAIQCIVHAEAPNAITAKKQLKEKEGWSYQICADHRLQTYIRRALT